MDLLEKIQSLMKNLQCEPEQFTDRIISMSMFHDIEWGAKGTTEQKGGNTIHREFRIMLADSRAVVGLSLDLDQKRNGTELTLIRPTDLGTKLQNK